MDLNTALLVAEIAAGATAFGALVGLVSAALGQLINQWGQHHLAAAADLRKWQEGLIRPIIDLEGRRIAIFHQVLEHIRFSGGGYGQLVTDLYQRLASEELIPDRLPFWNLGDPQVRDAMEIIRKHDSDCMIIMRQMLTVGGDVPTMAEQLERSSTDLARSLRSLTAAVEKYIYPQVSERHKKLAVRTRLPGQY